MAENAVQICSAALVLVGANPITSFNDESNEAAVCNLFYESVRDNLLSSYPWRFCQGPASLVRLAETPADERYTYAYQLPADCLAVRETTAGDAYVLYENKLYTHAESITIVYQYRVIEGHFPVYFRLALTYELAMLFCSAIVEDGTKMERLLALCERQKKQARHVDSQQYPHQGLPESAFAITGVRYF